ncbi:Hypp7213 [Branchiostoma lanceolatum]|uniref:Hypp7213 protein n=1 Tax=Branchiostoma lanceolatum TaxID=7740 RepID=A0A8J9YYV7_BRALA|nr:Hypp7213 [Branchiostoma lanceolatum]
MARCSAAPPSSPATNCRTNRQKAKTIKVILWKSTESEVALIPVCQAVEVKELSCDPYQQLQSPKRMCTLFTEVRDFNQPSVS